MRDIQISRYTRGNGQRGVKLDVVLRDTLEITVNTDNGNPRRQVFIYDRRTDKTHETDIASRGEMRRFVGRVLDSK